MYVSGGGGKLLSYFSITFNGGSNFCLLLSLVDGHIKNYFLRVLRVRDVNVNT